MKAVLFLYAYPHRHHCLNCPSTWLQRRPYTKIHTRFWGRHPTKKFSQDWRCRIWRMNRVCEPRMRLHPSPQGRFAPCIKMRVPGQCAWRPDCNIESGMRDPCEPGIQANVQQLQKR